MADDAQIALEDAMARDNGFFGGLVSDTILYEWCRTCFHNDQLDAETGLVLVDHSSFAKWFRIAIETCTKFRRYFPAFHFDKLLRVKGLQDSIRVQSHFRGPWLGLDEFFPKEEDEDEFELTSAVRAHGFLLPPMDDAPSDNQDEALFLYEYSTLVAEYQQMTALIITTLLKKWKSDALDHEPTEIFMGHKVLYRLMPSYNKVLKEAYRSHGKIEPPTPLEAFVQAHHDLNARMAAAASSGATTSTPAPAGPTPMYDLFGVNTSLKRLSADARTWPSVTQLATQFYNTAKSSHRAETQRSDLIRRVQTMLNYAFPGYDLKIEAFGSAAIGLGSENSDLDLCITTPHFERNAPYNNMITLARLFQSRQMRKVVPVAHARVPIVKFEDSATGIKVDINCNHVLGVHNSQLIKTYMNIDPRLPRMLYVLKALIKIHGIHDSSRGLLSSYTIVMMAIAFLQSQNILPNLQGQSKDRMTQLRVQLDHDGRGGHDLIDCTFDRDWRRHEGYSGNNHKTLGQLLFEFFEFFARDFNYSDWEVNIRRGGFCTRNGQSLSLHGGSSNGSSSSNGLRLGPLGVPKKTGSRRAEFIVMDPFLRQRNVAGTCRAKNLPHVWAVFDYLYERFAEGDWHGAMKTMRWPRNDSRSNEGRGKQIQANTVSSTTPAPVSRALFMRFIEPAPDPRSETAPAPPSTHFAAAPETMTTTTTTTTTTMMASSLANSSVPAADGANGKPKRNRRRKKKDTHDHAQQEQQQQPQQQQQQLHQPQRIQQSAFAPPPDHYKSTPRRHNPPAAMMIGVMETYRDEDDTRFAHSSPKRSTAPAAPTHAPVPARSASSSSSPASSQHPRQTARRSMAPSPSPPLLRPQSPRKQKQAKQQQQQQQHQRQNQHQHQHHHQHQQQRQHHASPGPSEVREDFIGTITIEEAFTRPPNRQEAPKSRRTNDTTPAVHGQAAHQPKQTARRSIPLKSAAAMATASLGPMNARHRA
ncbi:hypothetical protein DFQ26_000943 [Actinomortierella ambigua]|nr:hypothetical protein DFQ26_000943 [Actinomortierella ambigua]